MRIEGKPELPWNWNQKKNNSTCGFLTCGLPPVLSSSLIHQRYTLIAHA